MFALWSQLVAHLYNSSVPAVLLCPFYLSCAVAGINANIALLVGV